MFQAHFSIGAGQVAHVARMLEVIQDSLRVAHEGIIGDRRNRA